MAETVPEFEPCSCGVPVGGHRMYNVPELITRTMASTATFQTFSSTNVLELL